MPVSRSHRLVVLGGEKVGKTAIIEQFIFGNHVIGQVSEPALNPRAKISPPLSLSPSLRIRADSRHSETCTKPR